MDIDTSYHVLEFSRSATKAGHIREWDPSPDRNKLMLRLQTVGHVVDSHLLLSVVRLMNGKLRKRQRRDETAILEQVKLSRIRTHNGDIDVVADAQQCMVGISYPGRVYRKMFEIRLVQRDYTQSMTILKMAGIKVTEVRADVCTDTPEPTQDTFFNRPSDIFGRDNLSETPSSLNTTLSRLFANSQIRFASDEASEPDSSSNAIMTADESNITLREQLISILADPEFVSFASRIEFLWKDLTRW